MSKSKKILYNMVLIALFSALSFVGTYIAIPIGTSKVHLGNFVCILAGLLCGGLIGGLSGSLGMGLNDLLSGYGVDTCIRTLIVKFILGLFAGLLFRYFLKKEKNINYLFFIISFIFLILFITFLTLYLAKGEVIDLGKKKLSISIILISLLGVMFAFFLIIQIFIYKINKIQKYVLASVSLASLLNVVLEFLLKIPFKVLMANMTWEQSFIYALSSLPGALITSIVTSIIVTCIYLPLYEGTKRFNKLNNLNDMILDITTYKKESSPNNEENSN